MSWTGWLIFILIIQVIHFLGTWKLYIKAGRQPWEAAVPVYNAVVLMKIINRPWWWTILLFVPIVNLIMFPVVWVETLRSFGKKSYTDTALGILTSGLYIGYINYTQDVTYIKDRSLKPKSSSGEWTSAILFAVVAATIVHTYVMQPFTIPTSSLEKTLLVGDFLFVSKFHYGARAPKTAVSFPMVHDTIPLLKKKSYFSGLEFPYFRMPGFQEIKRNDIVVFSWPVDTLVDIRPGVRSKSAYKPIDKKSNYVKRCVGVPGDSLEVRDGYVYIDGKQNDLPDRAKLQFGYQFATSQQLDPKFAAERYNITDLYPLNNPPSYKVFGAHMTDEEFEKLKHYPYLDTIIKTTAPKGVRNPGIFPQDDRYDWNADNFGPLFIPKKGSSVAITQKTLPLYRRIIEVYEGSELGIDNKISLNGTQVLLNGAPLTDYTFKMDYYWMMGDNRSNSQDARMWGFVPFNHVVGKPVMVWLSYDSKLGKMRWDRMFTTVKGEGKPTSYLWLAVLIIVSLFGWDYYRRRKRKSKS